MNRKKETEKLIIDSLKELRIVIEEPCATDRLATRLTTIKNNLEALSQKTSLSEGQKKTIPVNIGDRKFYSVSEVSQKLDVTPVTVWKYLRQGKLKGQKTMGKWFISEEDLIDFFHNSN